MFLCIGQPQKQLGKAEKYTYRRELTDGQNRARICKPFKEPRNRLHWLGKSIPLNRFMGSLNVYKYGLWIKLLGTKGSNNLNILYCNSPFYVPVLALVQLRQINVPSTGTCLCKKCATLVFLCSACFNASECPPSLPLTPSQSYCHCFPVPQSQYNEQYPALGLRTRQRLIIDLDILFIMGDPSGLSCSQFRVTGRPDTVYCTYVLLVDRIRDLAR